MVVKADNTWNETTIESFHSLTKKPVVDFQLASSTLDSCVKVYTSRIDNVTTLTNTLLLKLLPKDGATSTPSKVAAKRRKTKTLVDNDTLICQLTVEGARDPLFHKTASDFDEGGARGLLLSHLDISKDGRIIFDSAAASLVEDESKADDAKMDMTEMRRLFNRKMRALDGLMVSKTFGNFSFTNTSEDYDREDFFKNDEEVVYEEEQPYENDFQTFEDPIDSQEMEGSEMVERLVNRRESGGNPLALFDISSGSSWAGSEFWKTRNVKSGPTNSTATIVRKKKEKIYLDFLVDLDRAEVFKVTKTAISAQVKVKLDEMNLLPDDKSYNSERFVTLFLKPFKISKFTQHTTMEAVAKTVTVGSNVANDEPFEGFDFDGDGDEAAESFEMPTFEDIKPVDFKPIGGLKPVPLQFAKTAKKVDVSRLKTNLWTNLEQSVKTESKFTEIVKLDQFYEEKQLSNISVAFCFICVLHLANENNLTITGGGSELIINKS